MPAEIRPAIPTDADALLVLRRKLYGESNTMLWEPHEFVATEDDERQRIEQLTSAPNCTYLVASKHSALVGLLFATGRPINRLRHSTTLALAVLREHQGKGIATQLVRTALEWSTQVGLKRVELTVHTTNLPAISVYLRCGFLVEGTRRASLRVDGVWVDEYLMSVVHSGV